jgi:hypothetical protein
MISQKNLGCLYRCDGIFYFYFHPLSRLRENKKKIKKINVKINFDSNFNRRVKIRNHVITNKYKMKAKILCLTDNHRLTNV